MLKYRAAMRTPAKHIIGLLVCFLFNAGNNFVRGDDNSEIQTCNSVCKPKLNIKLNIDIPEYCDSVEKRCTSCGPQCKYNRRMGVDRKCLCYCQTHHPEYGPYQIQFTCEPNLALDTREEQTVGISDKLGIGVGAFVGGAVVLVVLAVIFVILKRRRCRRPDEESATPTASRDPLLDQSDQSNHAQPDLHHAQPVEEVYANDSLVPSSMKNQFLPPVVAQEEHQDGTTAVKAVIDHRPSTISDKSSEPPTAFSDQPASGTWCPGEPEGSYEREIKDQERGLNGPSEKVVWDGQ